MSPKYIITFTLLFAAMLGWNAFLIVRDNKLFDAYYTQSQKQFCEQYKSWHPDCKK